MTGAAIFSKRLVGSDRLLQLLSWQFAQHLPHPSMSAVEPDGGFGEHQDAFAMHNVDAIFLAELDRPG